MFNRATGVVLAFLGVSLSAQLFSLYTKPWLGDVYEWELQTAFTYSRYRKVQDAAVQLHAPSNDKLITLDLDFIPTESLDAQFEVEFADTPRQSLGLRSLALQARYLWLNDVTGDPCSLISGLNVREVTRHSLHDVSSPYHSDFNFEVTTALGKEWSKEGIWTMRTWGLGAIGQANHGSPWIRLFGAWESNRRDRHRLLLSAEGYFGFGHKKHVDVDHFDGWANVRHQSIDLAIAYGYHFEIWGILGFQYAYRIFSKSFPEHVNFITVFYRLPFSPF